MRIIEFPDSVLLTANLAGVVPASKPWPTERITARVTVCHRSDVICHFQMALGGKGDAGRTPSTLALCILLKYKAFQFLRILIQDLPLVPRLL